MKQQKQDLNLFKLAPYYLPVDAAKCHFLPGCTQIRQHGLKCIFYIINYLKPKEGVQVNDFIR